MLAADWLPSRSLTTIGPETAPSGTRTFTTFLVRRTGAAATSSASPGAPWKITSYVRPSHLPRRRSIEPVVADHEFWQLRLQLHERSSGTGRTTTPGGGADSCGCGVG